MLVRVGRSVPAISKEGAVRNDLFLTILLGTSLIALPSDASSWQQIPGYKTSYIDLASIRRDTFPRQYTTGITNGWVDGHRDMLTFTVTWLSLGSEGAKSEVVYDCSCQMAVMQQVIPNETSASQYHSFDNTQ